MIDFDALVLRVCAGTFARPITVYPDQSQPGALPYPARAIWGSRPVDVPVDGGAILSSQDHTLGIRVREFTIPPVQGDRILVDAYKSLPRLGVCLIEDGDDDGQGGTVLSIKVIGP